MNYAAGLDGGGTKTAVAVIDESGRVVHTFTSGGINYNGQDEISIRQTLQEIMSELAEACSGLDRCLQVGVGAAGISNPAAADRIASAIRACGYRGGLTIVGDYETALYGALEQDTGMILIAGTGSICYGKNASGQAHRSGGFGHLIDDEGSGYSIGRDLLAAVVRSHDGRAPATAISGLVYERLGMESVQQIVGYVYDRNRHKKDIAALAPILSEACALGDETALRIADRCAESLCELAATVAEKLSLQQGTLAMTGSVLLKNDEVRNAFLSKLKQRFPLMDCIPAKHDPSVGAALLALSRMGTAGLQQE